MIIREFLFAKRERLVLGAFLAGFILDNLALPRIDFNITHIVLLVYLFVAAAGALLLNLAEHGANRGSLARFAPFFFAIMQFAFGGLLSGYFVFYTRSASLASGWIFILLLTVLLVGNEVFKRRYQEFLFQVSVLFTTIFFFTIFYVPIVFKNMGAIMFLISGAISLAIIGLFLSIFAKLVPGVLKQAKKTIVISIGSIYVLVNGLYFLNIIPPIPLALKSAGVYHAVYRTDAGAYAGQGERAVWYDLVERFRPTIRITQGEPVFFFSAVFAPTKLGTTILHEWQYFNEEQSAWVTTDRLGFQIVGGRDGGYRGYSVKESVAPGRWRVNVITERNQLLGRTTFTVIDIPAVPTLVTKTLE